MSDTYVLVHGAWHTGAEIEPAAEHIRKLGHTVHCPTMAGNRPGDDRAAIGLDDAVASLVDFVVQHDLRGIRLVGHSWGGMVISGAIEKLGDRVARLVYVNAFVPNPGESLTDMVPPLFVDLFEQIAVANGNAVMLPFPIWREAFINDADLALATSAYEKLNLQSHKTLTDKSAITRPLAAMEIGKSYVNCRMDTALPHGFPWHPRLSEKLGLFRYVECSGSHEVWFTNPEAIAHAVVTAGRD